MDSPNISRRSLLRYSGMAVGAAGLGTLLSACGAGADGGGSDSLTGTLQIYSNLTGSKKAAADAVYDAFKKANSGAQLQVTEFGDVASSHTKLLAAIASGTVPDLVINHYYLATVYADGGHLVDLDDKLASSSLKIADFDKRFTGSGMWKGKRVSLPYFASSRTLMYNGKAVKAAGLDPAKPPANWKELREWAIATTQRQGGKLKRAGLKLDPPPGEYGENLFALLLWSAGGSLISPDGKRAAFNTPAGQAALEFWHSLIYDDKVFDIGFTGPGGNDAFVAETAALTFGLNPIAYFAQKAKLTFGSVPIPGKDSGTISMSDPFSIYMLKNAKKPALAWKFIEFANSYEQQVGFCAGTYSLPSVTKAQSAPEIAKLDQLQPFVKALDVATPLPVIPQYVEFWDAISRNIEAALTNKKDITTALNNAEAEANKILGR